MDQDCLIVVIGDSPRLHTGLSRIARDITQRLWAARERLGIQVAQVAWEPRGVVAPMPPWPLVTFAELEQDWGAEQVLGYVNALTGQLGVDPSKVVLFTIWDPARCFEYRHTCENLWGYFAVDGHNRHGRFGGPAAETVVRYKRVLAYTEYGAQVLHDTIAHTNGPGPVMPVSYLPHGHDWGAAQRADAIANCLPPTDGWQLGCVATNQPRKDLGLFFAVLSILREQGEPVHGWLHTDALVTSAWSIPELLEVYTISQDWCYISAGLADERYLQAMYAGCAVTLAPGRGEGFGYPIVESYAMGRPVVHTNYGGGKELTLPEGRVDCIAYDTANPYVLQRPILHPQDVAIRCQQLAHQMLADPTRAAYYAGTVANLHWDQLWPRWETWIRQGLRELRSTP
jgi:glycosyltransferase involved in cell wall biosynthesis